MYLDKKITRQNDEMSSVLFQLRMTRYKRDELKEELLVWKHSIEDL